MVVLAVTWLAKAGRESEVADGVREADGGIAQGTRLRDVSGAPPQDRAAAVLHLRTV